jgi:tryptophan-rich sensory protein
MDVIKWPYLGFILALLIPCSQFIWPIDKTAGITVKARPPPWFFGFIWSLIVGIIGVVWYIITKCLTSTTFENKLICYSTLAGLAVSISLCIAWMGVYSKDKKYGVFIMWALIGTLLMTALTALNISVLAADLLVIPITWAIFAAILNIIEVQSLP